MNSRNATGCGFVAAVCVPPTHFALSTLSREPGIESISDGFTYLVIAFLTFLPYSALAGLIVGLPIFFVSSRFGLFKWWAAVVVGSIAGALFAFTDVGSEPLTIQLLVFIPLGAISGLVFWTTKTIAMHEK